MLAMGQCCVMVVQAQRQMQRQEKGHGERGGMDTQTHVAAAAMVHRDWITERQRRQARLRAGVG